MKSRIDELGVFELLEAFIVDLNGVPRGKWIPVGKAERLARDGLPMPRSLFAQDIWGSDVEAAGLAFGTGDPDGACFPVLSTVAPAPWAQAPTAQVLLTMRESDGSGYFIDPRVILQKQIDRFSQRGLIPAAAIELEFYLIADQEGPPSPVRAAAPGDGASPRHAGNVLSVDVLADHEPFINEVLSCCRRQSLDVESILHENSPGQFEITLSYDTDACIAADNAVIFKRLVKKIARRHGLRACFMAKPFGDLAGSGMHAHLSLFDERGRPVFADDDGVPTALFHHALGGLLNHMPEAMLLFAPNANSYRRFRPDSHAPMRAGWGWGDRSAALRAIEGTPTQVRIEHRVAGADANPYLVLAAVLAAAFEGIERQIDPGEPQDTGASLSQGSPLPLDWRSAIELFERSEFVEQAFGADVRDVISACKWQDYHGMLALVPNTEYEAYLETA